MCLIIHREEGQEPIEQAFFKDVEKRNSDGWGIMWQNPRDNEVRTKVGFDFQEFWSLYRSLENKNVEMFVHFRMATHGSKTAEMCHPFEVIPGMYMMHNGVISTSGIGSKDNTKSDTWEFVNNAVKPILEAAKDPAALLRTDAFVYFLNEAAGNSNRLVFLDKNGWFIPNISIWSKTTKNVRVSNTYAYNMYNPTKKTYTQPTYKNQWWTNKNGTYTNNYAESYDYGVDKDYYGYKNNKTNLPVIRKTEDAVEEKEEKPLTGTELFCEGSGKVVDLDKKKAGLEPIEEFDFDDYVYSDYEDENMKFETMTSWIAHDEQYADELVYTSPEDAVELLNYLANQH